MHALKPQREKSLLAFLGRLKHLVERRIDLSPVEKSHNGLVDLILREQIHDGERSRIEDRLSQSMSAKTSTNPWSLRAECIPRSGIFSSGDSGRVAPVILSVAVNEAVYPQ